MPGSLTLTPFQISSCIRVLRPCPTQGLADILAKKSPVHQIVKRMIFRAHVTHAGAIMQVEIPEMELVTEKAMNQHCLQE